MTVNNVYVVYDVILKWWRGCEIKPKSGRNASIKYKLYHPKFKIFDST